MFSLPNPRFSAEMEDATDEAAVEPKEPETEFRSLSSMHIRRIEVAKKGEKTSTAKMFHSRIIGLIFNGFLYSSSPRCNYGLVKT